jgi:hypothetical protein
MELIKIPDVSPLYILDQIDVLRAIGHAAIKGLTNNSSKDVNIEELLKREFPEYQEVVPPRSNKLIDDYLKFLRANVSAYKNEVPFHFFPQWSFSVVERALSDLPFNFIQVMNAGYKAEINSSIPRNEKIYVKAQLQKIELKNNILYFTTRIVSETQNAPEALVAYLTALLKLPKKDKVSSNDKKAKSYLEYTVPFEAKEIARFNFPSNTGLNYSILSGDINPVHWLEPYAQMMGFKRIILHGFASSAFCIEAINNNLFAGNVHRIKEVEIKFTKPLLLPAKPKLYYLRENNHFYLAEARLSRAYITANFKTNN